MNNKQIFKQEIKKYTPLEIVMGSISFICMGTGIIMVVLFAWDFIVNVFGQ